MSFKTFPKPVKKVKKSKWGVYRKYSKPIQKKKVVTASTRPAWSGDPLLEPPYQGHYLYEVTNELYEQVYKRAKGMCENPDCTNKGQEVNHIVSHSRRAHLENLNFLCMDCHRLGKDSFHSFGKFYKYCMKKYQDWCFKAGYTEEQVKWLLAKKDRRLY